MSAFTFALTRVQGSGRRGDGAFLLRYEAGLDTGDVPDDLNIATPEALLQQLISMGNARPVPAEAALIEQAFTR